MGAPGDGARGAPRIGACDRAPGHAMGRASQDGPAAGSVRPWKGELGAPLPRAGGAQELTLRVTGAMEESKAGPVWSCCCAAEDYGNQGCLAVAQFLLESLL